MASVSQAGTTRIVIVSYNPRTRRIGRARESFDLDPDLVLIVAIRSSPPGFRSLVGIEEVRKRRDRAIVEIWRGRPYAIKWRRDVSLGIEDGFELAVFAKPTFAETLSKIPRKRFNSHWVGANFAKVDGFLGIPAAESVGPVALRAVIDEDRQAGRRERLVYRPGILRRLQRKDPCVDGLKIGFKLLIVSAGFAGEAVNCIRPSRIDL